MATDTAKQSTNKDTYKTAKTSTAGAAVGKEPSAAGAKGQRGQEETCTPNMHVPTNKFTSL